MSEEGLLRAVLAGLMALIAVLVFGGVAMLIMEYGVVAAILWIAFVLFWWGIYRALGKSDGC